MKNNKRNQASKAVSWMVVATVVAASGIGCSRSGGGFSATASDAQTTTPSVPVTPSSTAITSIPGWTGAVVDLKLDSVDALSYYMATSTANNPSQVQVGIQLSDNGQNQYAGDVVISYVDNNQQHLGRFVALNKNNPSSGSHYPNYNQAAYNQWFTWQGQNVFHGFFQDQYGAVMVIVDDAVDLGDGAGATSVSGSIWFKNFANSYALPNDNNIPCWFVTTGPYDCRAFLVSGDHGDGVVNSTSALYPQQSLFITSHESNPYIPQEAARGWRRLGTFSNLNRATAFGN